MKFPEQYRIKYDIGHWYYSETGDLFGSFQITGTSVVTSQGRTLNIIASESSELSDGWDHVSVSVDGSDDTPTWFEMCLVKDLFWAEDECVCQFHPPKAVYKNLHPGVLHLWRCGDKPFPMPPLKCV
jgi:hypothetical protein